MKSSASFGLFVFHSSVAHKGTVRRRGAPPWSKGYEEKQDLVVLQGTAQAHEGDEEQEDAHADDACHHPDARDQAEPFPPGCHSDQQQTHQLRKGEKTTTSALDKIFIRQTFTITFCYLWHTAADHL